MLLAAPLFAWLLPLALLPVFFHLFFRIRKPPRVFPSLLFFLAADPRLQARRRLREWLVLLLRTLALVALLLALARPMQQGWGGNEACVTVIIDNSASMAAVDGAGQSRLSRALAAATAVLQDPAVRQAAVITTVRDLAVALPAGFSEDLASLRVSLGAIRASHGSGDVAGALHQAAALSRGMWRGSVEVHIFTDLQATEWGTATAPVAFAHGTRVVVHDVGRSSDQAGAVALLPPTTLAHRLVAGQPWSYEAQLRNYGSRDVECQVNLALGDTRLRQTATVDAGQTRVVHLALSGLPAGEHLVRVWLDGAAAGPSAEAWQVVRVVPPDDVWLLGDSRDYGMLGLALAPAADGLLSGLRVQEVPNPVAARVAGRASPVLLVVAWRQFADAAIARCCHDFAAEGGTVLVCPETSWTPASKSVLPDWCGVAPGAEKVSENGEAMVVFVAEAALWDDLRDEHGYVSLRGVQLRRWLPLTARTPDGAKPLAGTADGGTVLMRTAVGRGVVYVSGLAWDLRWSNLPRRAAFLPLALGFAQGRPLEEPARMSQAGTPFADRREGPGAGVHIRTVAGDLVSWSGRAEALSTPARAGVYRVEGFTQPLTLAVSGSPAEAAPTLASARKLAVLAGTGYDTLTYRSAAESAAGVQRARRGQSLFGLFLTLAAACWLAELWLVNQRRPAALQRWLIASAHPRPGGWRRCGRGWYRSNRR